MRPQVYNRLNEGVTAKLRILEAMNGTSQIALMLMLMACSAPPEESICYHPSVGVSWGADDYGMKSYVMAFLRAGPNRKGSPEERNALQQAHMSNIGKMAAEGQLLLAGPFLDGGEIRGIYIFNTSDTSEARMWTAKDPAIETGSLAMELHPWYGSAALASIQPLHNLIQKKGIAE